MKYLIHTWNNELHVWWIINRLQNVSVRYSTGLRDHVHGLGPVAGLPIDWPEFPDVLLAPILSTDPRRSAVGERHVKLRVDAMNIQRVRLRRKQWSVPASFVRVLVMDETYDVVPGVTGSIPSQNEVSVKLNPSVVFDRQELQAIAAAREVGDVIETHLTKDTWRFKPNACDAHVEPDLVEDLRLVQLQVAVKLVFEVLKNRLKCVAISIAWQRNQHTIRIHQACITAV